MKTWPRCDLGQGKKVEPIGSLSYLSFLKTRECHVLVRWQQACWSQKRSSLRTGNQRSSVSTLPYTVPTLQNINTGLAQDPHTFYPHPKHRVCRSTHQNAGKGSQHIEAAMSLHLAVLSPLERRFFSVWLISKPTVKKNQIHTTLEGHAQGSLVHLSPTPAWNGHDTSKQSGGKWCKWASLINSQSPLASPSWEETAEEPSNGRRISRLPWETWVPAQGPPVPAPTLNSDFAKIQKLTQQYLSGQEFPGPCSSLHPYWLVSSPCWLLRFLNINPDGPSHMGQKRECLLLLDISLDLRPSVSLFFLTFWKV